MKVWKIVLLGMVVIVVIGNLILDNEDGKAREIRLIQEYQAINHPNGAKLIHYELNRKIIKRWIHSRYSYSINNSEIAKYYKAELLNKGWRQIHYGLPPGKEGYRFTKENLVFSIALNRYNSWTIFMGYSDADY